MKSERRHELQHNVLADTLGKWLNRAAPYLKVAGWAALLLAVVLLGMGIWSYYRNKQMAAAWQEYMEALASADSRTELEDLAASRPGSTVAIWAQLSLADNALASGTQLIYRNRDEAERMLTDAREDYEQVLESASKDAYLRQRAAFGLAQTFETMGELKKARTHYEQVVEMDPDNALGKQARAQIQLLKDQEIRGFYDWFVAQRDVPRPPGAGFGLEGLDGLNNLPDSPNFDIDSLLNRTTPSDQPGSAAADDTQFDSSILNETLGEPGDSAPPAIDETAPAGGEPPVGDEPASTDTAPPAGSDGSQEDAETTDDAPAADSGAADASGSAAGSDEEPADTTPAPQP